VHDKQDRPLIPEHVCANKACEIARFEWHDS
jgi:hypothetical protein